MSTLSALFDEVPIEFTCSQESDIHSVGFTRLISASITPLIVVSVLACLLSADMTKSMAEVKESITQVNITNSISKDDPCVAPVSEATNIILKSLDVEAIYGLCRAAHEARKRAGLDPSAKSVER